MNEPRQPSMNIWYKFLKAAPLLAQ